MLHQSSPVLIQAGAALVIGIPFALCTSGDVLSLLGSGRSEERTWGLVVPRQYRSRLVRPHVIMMVLLSWTMNGKN